MFIVLNENSQHLRCDSVLLAAIERLTVEVNDSSIASLRATQLTFTTKLKPGNGQNRPMCVSVYTCVSVYACVSD